MQSHEMLAKRRILRHDARHRDLADLASRPVDVDLAPPAFLNAVEVVKAVFGDYRLGVAQDLLAIAVVSREHGGAPDDGDAGLRESETAGIDGLLTVADHEQAVRLVADEGMQQLQTDARQVLHLVNDALDDYRDLVPPVLGI
jgi:hypothetical protein